MKDARPLSVPSVSIAYPALLLEIARERGVDTADILHAAGLSADMLTQKGAFITPVQYTLMTLHTARLTQDQGIGLALGLRLRPTAHGQLGLMMLSSNTLREALDHSRHFGRVRQRTMRLMLHTEGDTAIVRLQELRPIGRSRHFFVEGMLTGSAIGMPYLLGAPVPELTLHFDIPEPAYFAPYKDRLPPTHFACEHNEIRFPAHYLDRPLALSNRSTANEALIVCEQVLAEIGHEHQLDHIVAQVRELITQDRGFQTSVDDAARLLCMSTRTLKRKLQACGTSFVALQEDVRLQRALRLMANPLLPIQDIAHTLGYVDPANFTRAFRRWTGESPSRYRRGPA